MSTNILLSCIVGLDISVFIFLQETNSMCLQERKWVGEKVREVGKSGFKLWYTRNIRVRNMGNIADQTWIKVVDLENRR